MLIKKIYIMKGTNTVKSVLKVTLLEKGYAEIDLQTHFAYGDNYTFILKSGNFIHVEAMRSKGLKRKMQPFSLEGLCTGIAREGKIIMWSADTPNVPYCLVELAQKYATIKANNANENQAVKAIIAPKSLEMNNNRLLENGKAENVDTIIVPETKQLELVEDIDATANPEKISIKEETEVDVVVENNVAVDPVVNTGEVVSQNESVAAIEVVEVEENKPHDIAKDFNILAVESDGEFESEKIDSTSESVGVVAEIEAKYPTYPHNETLETVFPGSKWIMADSDEFSLGLLYNSTQITHICYAKKGEKDDCFDHNATYYEGWWVVITDNE